MYCVYPGRLFCQLNSSYLQEMLSDMDDFFYMLDFSIAPIFWLKNISFFLKKFYLLVFREREKEGEKHQCVVASYAPPTGDLTDNPGMCPD